MAYGTSNSYIVYGINAQQVSQDIANNTSTINVWVDIWRTNSGYTTYGSGTVYCRINGTLYSASITSSQRITSTPIRIGEWTVTVPHDSDGNKSFTITAWFSHDRFTSSEQGFAFTCSTIPRAASITGFSCATSYLDGKMTVSYESKATFTYYLRLSIPNVVQIYRASLGSQSSGTKTTTYTFTSTELQTIYKNVTGSAVAQIGAVIETYSGLTKVGESTEEVLNLTMPTTVIPSFTSVAASGIDLFNNLYLQSKSKVKLTVNGATGTYGSTIKSYSIRSSDGNISYTGQENNYTTNVLTKAGQITFTATITDSRNRTASKSVTITVNQYSGPTLSVNAYRCNSAGVMDMTNGTYIAVAATYSYASISGNSISSRSIKIDNASKSTSFASGTRYTYGTYSLSTTHVVTVSVTDAVGTTAEVEVEIREATVIADYQKDRVGFGRFCTQTNQMQVAYDLNLFGGFKVADENQPVFTLVETVDVTI